MSQIALNQAPRTRGWHWPANSAAPHFFLEGFSLCGKARATSDEGTDTDIRAPEDCEYCHEQLRLLRRAEARIGRRRARREERRRATRE